MDVMGLQDQLLIVEKIISKALNLWFGASLYMLEFIKAKKKKKNLFWDQVQEICTH